MVGMIIHACVYLDCTCHCKYSSHHDDKAYWCPIDHSPRQCPSQDCGWKSYICMCCTHTHTHTYTHTCYCRAMPGVLCCSNRCTEPPSLHQTRLALACTCSQSPQTVACTPPTVHIAAASQCTWAQLNTPQHSP